MFLEKLYMQYVINFLSTINTLFWEGLQDGGILLLSNFLLNGENAIPGKNPNNPAELRALFFDQSKRSNLSLHECVDLSKKCNASYLTEIKIYAEEQYPSAFNVAEYIPHIKNGVKNAELTTIVDKKSSNKKKNKKKKKKD